MWIIKLALKKYPWVFVAPIIVGIILVGASTAYTMYRAFRYTPPSTSSGKVVTTDSPESRPTLDHYAVIYQRALFTSALQTKEEKAKTDLTKTNAPTVPFKLKGTVVVSPGVSCAIIEDSATRKEELYHQDETVQGFKIVKILRNKVIVDKDGLEEVVEVVEEQEKAPVRPSQRPRTTEKKTPIRRPVRKVPPGTKVPLDLQ